MTDDLRAAFDDLLADLPMVEPLPASTVARGQRRRRRKQVALGGATGALALVGVLTFGGLAPGPSERVDLPPAQEATTPPPPAPAPVVELLPSNALVVNSGGSRQLYPGPGEERAGSDAALVRAALDRVLGPGKLVDVPACGLSYVDYGGLQIYVEGGSYGGWAIRRPGRWVAVARGVEMVGSDTPPGYTVAGEAAEGAVVTVGTSLKELRSIVTNLRVGPFPDGPPDLPEAGVLFFSDEFVGYLNGTTDTSTVTVLKLTAELCEERERLKR